MNSACLIVVEFDVGNDKEESLTKLYEIKIYNGFKKLF
jgi:hypothetical protein